MVTANVMVQDRAHHSLQNALMNVQMELCNVQEHFLRPAVIMIAMNVMNGIQGQPVQITNVLNLYVHQQSAVNSQ